MNPTADAPTTAETAPEAPKTFADLGIAPELANVLADQGILEPFPIQAAAIPDALSGRDVSGQARTGSGKTLAFGLPMLQATPPATPKRPTGLVLVPTRELANQVTEVLRPLADAVGKSLIAVYGGTSISKQSKALADAADIVIATPGRLIDLMERKAVNLGDVAIVAIDEADQMADMGFLPQVRRILRTVPDDHQTLLFSATLDGQVGALIAETMSDPVRHQVETAAESVDAMDHRFLKVHHLDKVKVAAAIARNSERTLVFVRTKHMCDRVADQLRKEGVNAVALHGDRQQRHRQEALDAFADGEAPVLVATNVAARGLDIDGVDVVIHYDPPDDPKTFVHRSGRTARAGESGLVVTLVEWDQVNEVLKIQRRAGLNVPIIKMFSNDERLADLTSWEPPEELIPFRGGKSRRRRI